MNDKRRKKQKDRIKKYIDKWKVPMGLAMWRLTPIWDSSYNSNPGVAAVAYMEGWKYLEADITFHLPKCEASDDEEMERIVIHELSHILLSPISTNMINDNEGYWKQIMELNTEIVARAIQYSYEFGVDSGKSKK